MTEAPTKPEVMKHNVCCGGPIAGHKFNHAAPSSEIGIESKGGYYYRTTSTDEDGRVKWLWVEGERVGGED